MGNDKIAAALGLTVNSAKVMDLSYIDKRILAQEVLNCQRDAEYYKQQYELEKARADRLAKEMGKIKLSSL